VFKAPSGQKKQIDVIVEVFKTSQMNEYCLLSKSGMFFMGIEKTGRATLGRRSEMFTFRFDPENS
jgi:hypothetical protein